MPLPQITGDPGTLLGGDSPQSGPAPSGAPSADAGDGGQNAQDQVRGAMQQLGALKQQTKATLEAISRQFPGTSQSAQQMQSAIDEALGRLMKDLVKTVQQPEPQGPKVLR